MRVGVCVGVGNFPVALVALETVTSQIYYELQRVSILAAVNLWKTKNSLSK